MLSSCMLQQGPGAAVLGGLRSLSALAAPAVKKQAGSLPLEGYFRLEVHLDEEGEAAPVVVGKRGDTAPSSSSSSFSSARREAPLAAAAIRAPRAFAQDTDAPATRREKVVFDFGARITCHMKRAETLAPATSPASASSRDPFEGIPFRGLAEYLGAGYMDAVEESKKVKKKSAGGKAGSVAADEEEVAQQMGAITSLFPVTSYVAKNLRSTFVVDSDKSKRRTRLSWYNPNDGMVPANWFKDGLIADMHWYRPFTKGNGWAAKANQ